MIILSEQKNIKSISCPLHILRILAAFFVVTIHYIMGKREASGTIEEDIVFLESFLRSCAVIFFLISGYFMFKKPKTLSQIMKYVLTKLAIPLFCVWLFALFTQGWFSGEMSLMESIISADYKTSLISALKWEFHGNMFYLWYVAALIKIYFTYPLLTFICVDTKRTNQSRWFIMALIAISCYIIPYVPVLSEYTYMYTPFTDYWIFLILLGYEFFRLTPKFHLLKHRKMLIIVCLLLYCINSILIATLTIRQYYISNFFDQRYFDTHSPIVTVSGILLFLIFLLMNPDAKIFKATAPVIEFVAKRTYTIYLIHWFVILILKRVSLHQKLLEFIPSVPSYFVFFICAFVTSFICATIIDFTTELLIKKPLKVMKSKRLKALTEV